MNWPVFAAVVGFVAFLALLPALFARRWTAPGLVVAIANMVVILMNAPAPLRGVMTPADSAYDFGWLESDGGIAAAIYGGAVVLGAFIAALLVLRNSRGPIMWLLVLIDGFLALNIGIPLADQLMRNPAEQTMKFGEYLTIPPPIAIPLLFLFFVLPFATGALIGLSRVGRRAEA